jgi:predicted nucleic acid-binding protein
MKSVFVDSYFYLALLNPRDRAHRSATTVLGAIAGRLVTSQWVLAEVGDALAGVADRAKFVRLVDELDRHENVEVIPASNSLFQRAIVLYRSRPDKDWPFTDCTSFVLMRDAGISEALTGDSHSQQAGFTALLASP